VDSGRKESSDGGADDILTTKRRQERRGENLKAMANQITLVLSDSDSD
jgi:hypothetical protein